MILGVPKEILPGESRVGLVPESIPKLAKLGLHVILQSGAGEASGYLDPGYREKGAAFKGARGEILAESDIILSVRNPSPEEAAKLREGQTLICMLNPFNTLDLIRTLASRKVSTFALEFMPRITRAQSMDVLSSMSSLAGYKAVLLAADHLPRIFPMMMTAAGTIIAARVFVIGAGVAGLQAIATARRLGAIVEAYDTRPVVKEQVQSLGAKFVELPLETADAQDKGGYAKAQSEDFYRKQQELMARHVAAADAVITTALVPGKRAPVLIPEAAVRGMKPGSVVVDLAAEQGGNCEGTEPDKVVVRHGVTIVGLLNLPSRLAYHASQMYSRNVTEFLRVLVKEGKVAINLQDEVVKGPLVTHEGQVVHDAIRKVLEAKA
jgi:NAD(P) transhydrogenase subunit alpha